MARCRPFMAPHLAPTVSRPGDAPTGRVDRSQTSVRHLRGRSTYVGEISPISVFKSPLGHPEWWYITLFRAPLEHADGPADACGLPTALTGPASRRGRQP